MLDIEENGRRRPLAKKEISLSPIRSEVVRRIEALFEIERSVNDWSPEERLQARQTLSRAPSGLCARTARQLFPYARLSQGPSTTC